MSTTKPPKPEKPPKPVAKCHACHNPMPKGGVCPACGNPEKP